MSIILLVLEWVNYCNFSGYFRSKSSLDRNWGYIIWPTV